jgi:23S rRNA (adenine2030-N6)-methyltransferase
MIALFKQSQVKNLLQAEFCLHQDSDEYGMTGTGLFIINPPWQLASQLEDILPYLQNKLGNKHSSYTLEQIIQE